MSPGPDWRKKITRAQNNPTSDRSWVHPGQSPTLPVAAHKELDWFGSKMLRSSSPALLVIMASFQESAILFWPFSPQSLREGAVSFSDFAFVPNSFCSQQLPLGSQRHALGQHLVQPVRAHLPLKEFNRITH